MRDWLYYKCAADLTTKNHSENIDNIFIVLYCCYYYALFLSLSLSLSLSVDIALTRTIDILAVIINE